MYSVEWEQQALDQLGALPSQAFPSFAEVVTLLEVAPWGGNSFDRQRPDTNMRAHAFGSHEGLMIYLILDNRRRVVVLRVLWAG